MVRDAKLKPDTSILFFTDLDGTLLDHETYSYIPARRALGILKREQIPLILCSSKTRAEMEIIQYHLRIGHPFISENGGGIFIPKGYFPFKVDGAGRIKKYEVIECGTPYWKLVETLHRVSCGLGIQVTGFSDMSAEELARESGLALTDARLAKKREFDEPFRVIDKSSSTRSRLLRALHDAGLRCTRGGRYFHLTGVTDKGLAVRRLKSYYKRTMNDFVTVGLGDSLNDLPMLSEVDIPLIIRNTATGDASRMLQKIPTARVSRKSGPRGWNEAVLETLGRGAAH